MDLCAFVGTYDTGLLLGRMAPMVRVPLADTVTSSPTLILQKFSWKALHSIFHSLSTIQPC